MSLEKKIVTLKSSDRETFEIEETVALQSQTIKHLVEDNCADNGIPLPNVTDTTLGKVLEYYKKHTEDADQGADLNTWDTEYMKVDTNKLYAIYMAVNYLSIKGLPDLGADTVANMIKGKSPEAIRKTFNITNVFPPDE